MDRRIACLDRYLSRLDAQLDALAVADRKAATAAIGVTQRLGDLSACRDAIALQRRTPLPQTAEDQREIAALEGELDALSAAFEAGHRDDLRPELDALAKRVRRLRFPPVSSHYEELRGRVLSSRGLRAEAIDAFAVGFRQAVLDGDLRRASRLAGSAARVHRSAGDAERSEDWLAMSGELVRGVDDGGQTRAAHLRQTASLLHIAGKFAEAEAVNLQIDALWSDTDEAHPDRVRALSALGVNRRELGRLDEAVTTHERALALAAAVYGAAHPHTVTTALELSTTLSYAARYDEALTIADDALEKARAIWPDGARAVPFINGRGMALTGLRRLSEAELAYREAQSVWAAVHGPDHFENATFLMNLAGAQTDGGHFGEAVKSATEARRVLEAHFGPDHPRVVAAAYHLALNLSKQDDPAGAVAELTIAEQDGRLARLPPVHEARARFLLARSVLRVDPTSPTTRARARALGQSARDQLAELPDGGQDLHAEVVAWLSSSDG